MPIELDHTIVPAYDNEASARFFAQTFGLQFEVPVSHFAPVRVKSDPDFDAIFQRIEREGIAYGSGPRSPDNIAINHHGGGRGLYFGDPNGHLLELLTA